MSQKFLSEVEIPTNSAIKIVKEGLANISINELCEILCKKLYIELNKNNKNLYDDILKLNNYNYLAVLKYILNE